MNTPEMFYKGYAIAPKKDFGRRGNKIEGTDQWKGWVVVGQYNTNAMPGACWFHTVDSAKHGIDSLLAAGGEPHVWHPKFAPGKMLARNPDYDNKLFWKLVRQDPPAWTA